MTAVPDVDGQSDPISPEHRRRAGGLTLWPLMLGIGLLFVLGTMAVAGAIWLAGGQADTLAAADKVRQVERALATRAESLATNNLDWAWWNEAIDKLVLAPDRVYADQNLGAYGAETFGLYAALVVDPADRPVFAYLNGRPLPGSTAVSWLEPFQPLIDRTRADSADEPTPATAYLHMQDQLVFVSATAMMSEVGNPPIEWERPAVLLFVRAVDAEFLSSVAEAAGVAELRSAPMAAASRSHVALAGPTGEPIAALVWTFQPPSAAILAGLWPAALTILIVMTAVGGLMADRLLRMAARYRRERDLREKQLSLAMMEAREADHAKSQFLAAMSHEIRTPLNAVIGYAGLLQLGVGGPLTTKQREYMTDIESAGRHLLSLLQDILDLSKIEAGRDDLEESDVAVDTVVEKAIAMTAPRAREQGVALVIDSSPSVRLRADDRRLLQMLLNLLANAVRHSPDQGSVRIGWSVQNDGGVSLAIRDRGPGIRENDLAHVLEPFHRRVDSMVASSESTGLGLPLTARLMSLHGGRLQLANAPKGGLIATLWFPSSRTISVDRSRREQLHTAAIELRTAS